MTSEALHISVEQGGIPADMETLLNHIFSLLSDSFGVALPAFFMFFASTIQQQVNSFFGMELSSNQECHPPEPYPHNYNHLFTTYSFISSGAAFIICVPIVFILGKRFIYQGSVNC